MTTRAPRRVVITGLGVISPLGNTVDALWSALTEGRGGVRPIETVGAWRLPTTFAAEAREFSGSIDNFGPLEGEKRKAIRKGLKVMCRESQMGVAAAERALANAGLANPAAAGIDPDRAGVVFGSDYMLTVPEEFAAGIRQCLGPDGKFDFSRWGNEGIAQVTPLWLLKYLPNMPASHIAIYNDFRGPNNSLTLREASSNLAVGEALHTIVRGWADMMVAGATGTRVHPMKIVHSVTQEEVASNGVDPAHASRPFDRNRSGMVLGEGAGVVVLEELEFAKRRGARIYAEVLGAASHCVAEKRGIADRRKAISLALAAVLRDSGLSPRDVGHVHAHGLSTRSSDADEAAAIRDVFGDCEVPVTAAKSYFGNLGAGSGLVELIASVLGLTNGRLFPILNYDTPDPECPIAAVRSHDVNPGRAFINLSVTPQGQASAIAVGIIKEW